MASLAGISNFHKVPELRRRVLFTLGMLAVYRIGVFVSIPGVDRAVAQDLVNKAHIVCPYSNATRGNIDVTLTLA